MSVDAVAMALGALGNDSGATRDAAQRLVMAADSRQALGRYTDHQRDEWLYHQIDRMIRR